MTMFFSLACGRSGFYILLPPLSVTSLNSGGDFLLYSALSERLSVMFGNVRLKVWLLWGLALCASY